MEVIEGAELQQQRHRVRFQRHRYPWRQAPEQVVEIVSVDALWGGERPPAQALAELALWLAGLVLATRRLEAGLLGELWGYLRPGGERPAGRAAAAGRW